MVTIIVTVEAGSLPRSAGRVHMRCADERYAVLRQRSLEQVLIL
jgi:hypothetical protein